MMKALVIEDIKVITTAPEGINLVAVKSDKGMTQVFMEWVVQHFTQRYEVVVTKRLINT